MGQPFYFYGGTIVKAFFRNRFRKLKPISATVPEIFLLHIANIAIDSHILVPFKLNYSPIFIIMKTRLTLFLSLFLSSIIFAQDYSLTPIVDGFNVRGANTFYSSSIPYHIVSGTAKTTAYTGGVKAKYSTSSNDRFGFLFFDISSLTQEIGYANLRLTEKIGSYQTDETSYPFDVVLSYRYYDLNTSNIPVWDNQGDYENDYIIIDTISILQKAADVYNLNSQPLVDAITTSTLTEQKTLSVSYSERLEIQMQNLFPLKMRLQMLPFHLN